MDLRDCVGIEGIAGEPVEAVGGKDGDAAGSDAAFQRLAGDVGFAAADRYELLHVSTFTERAITTRSIPPKSRRVSISPKPASRISSATAGACFSPTSTASVPVIC